MPTKLLQTLGQVLLGQQNWVVCKCVTVEPPYLWGTRASWSLFLGSSSCSKDLWNSLLAASETPKELNLRSILASKTVGYSYWTQLPPPTSNSSTYVISVEYCMLCWELTLHFGHASHMPSIEVLLNCYYKMWVQFTGSCSVEQWIHCIHTRSNSVRWANSLKI